MKPFSQRPEKYVGFEDPELLHYIETLYELFPQATYVLLERDRLESEMSLARSGNIPTPIVTQKFDRWYEDIEKFKVVVGEYIKIHFEDMDNMKKIQEIWKYVLPNVPFDIDRWDMLTALHIHVTLGHKPYPAKKTSMAPYFDFNKSEFLQDSDIWSGEISSPKYFSQGGSGYFQLPGTGVLFSKLY